MSANPLAPDWLAMPADPNALDDAVWPRTLGRDDDGVASIGGVRVDELTRRFGTPLYVVDEADVRSRATEIRRAFEDAFAAVGGSASVYYAGKAFLCTAIAGWMAADGLGVDVCSAGELAVAIAGGEPPERIGFHGNNKSIAEIDRALAAGVGTIILDSEQEIARVADAASRHGRTQRVRLRVVSGIHAHTHEFLATAHEDQKFGVPLADAERLVARIREHESLRFIGLHCHIGSQIFDADGFAESARRLIEVHARLLAGGPIEELNLGGGFGIAYTPADAPVPIASLAARIAAAVASACEVEGIPLPRVAFEPGRAIAGPGGITLYTVGTTKTVTVGDAGAQRRYVSIDGGMSDNARTALYGADYTTAMLGRVSAAEPVLSRVAGKHCESGDIVVDAAYLPGDLEPGDLLGVAATGAYCWSLASNYNYLPRPAVVAVNGGAARVIVRGETEAELLRRSLNDADLNDEEGTGR